MSEITPARAIEIIKNLNFRAIGETKEANNLAIEALEKQITKKPKNSCLVINGHYCPVCGVVYAISKQNYCSNCGQKLDWEVEANE